MIIRSLLRRPNAVQSLVSASARCTPPSVARCIHTVPSLPQSQELKENGLPGLFSPRGFEIAYTEYMELVIDELNAVTSGTTLENTPTKTLAIQWARDPMMAHGFNCASMAFNNHTFFLGLNSNPNVTSAPSSELTSAIRRDFFSLETLKAEFLGTAEAMFGPGFVWLVQTTQGASHPFRILPTYLAGSPLSGAHYRKQSHDLNTHNANSYEGLNTAGAFGSNSAAGRRPVDKGRPLGGVDVTPLLCVNTWEHVWLHDYGIKGKRAYLEAWWNKIDWNRVHNSAQFPASNQNQNMSGQRNQFQRS